MKTLFKKQDRKEAPDYASTFLKKKEFKSRQCVYVSRNAHGIVFQIVRMFSGREITVGSYIDNVLMQHFEAHKDEINELYKNELQKK